VEQRCTKVVSALIAAGANVNPVVDDMTPLSEPTSQGLDDIVALLDQAGAVTWVRLVARNNQLLRNDDDGKFHFDFLDRFDAR
jgi:ankyrin repeat protein